MIAHTLATAADALGAIVDTEPSEDLIGSHPAQAAFDTARRYRYLLTRTWSEAAPVVFVMLNPSTADAFTVDNTITRCRGFAYAWGAGGLVVLNLFAFRSTDPKALYDAEDPIGPLNDALLDALPVGPKVIAAWGAHGALHDRGAQVTARLRARGHDLHCLGRTSSGNPRHPLYLRRDTTAAPYAPAPA